MCICSVIFWELFGVLETIKEIFHLLQVMSVKEMLLCLHRKFMRGTQSSFVFFFVVSYVFDISPGSQIFIFLHK